MKNKLYTKSPADAFRRWIILSCFMLLCVFATVVQGQVSVTASAGVPGPTPYTTLKGAFDKINDGTHQGIIIIDIVANTTEGTTPATLNSNGAGLAIYTSVLIRPTSDGVSISGNPITGFGVIQLKGADNVTIDGDNPNTGGTNRNLTVNNTTTTTVIANSVIRIATSAAVTSADNNTIKNCNLNGNVVSGNAAAITSTSGSSNSSFGIYVGGNGGATVIDAPTAITSVTTQTAPTGTTVNNLVIENNAIIQCARAIVINGASATVINTVTVSNNVIGASGVATPATPPFTAPSTTVYTKGIWLNGMTAATITGNTIQNIISYIGTTMTAIETVGAIGTGVLTITGNTVNTVCNNGTSSGCNGIQLASASGTFNVSGNNISNILGVGSSNGLTVATSATSGTVALNKITKVRSRSTSGFRASGITLGGGNLITCQNNFISDIMNIGTGSFSLGFGVSGISISGGINHKIYHNSVNLFGTSAATGSNAIFCLGIGASSQTGIDVRNNIFSNTVTGGTASDAHVCVFLPFAASATMLLTLNNNNYYAGSIATKSGVAFAGTSSYAAANVFDAASFDAANTTPATNFRSYSSALGIVSNDNASRGTTIAAPFVSATDLHIVDWTGGTEGGDFVANKGASVGVTTDIDAEQRPFSGNSNPAIGADEQTSPPCNSNNGGTLAASASACVGASAVVIAAPTGVSGGPGIAYQWYTADDNLGTNPVAVVGGSGATTVSYTTPSNLAAGVYYYLLGVKCLGGAEGFSTVITITVFALPVTAVSPTSASYCNPSPGIALSASGATTYTWSPAAGLSATTGSTVSATPISNTTYTVTGTSNGCSTTATVSITVIPGVSLNSITANPSGVCSGGNSVLTAVASLANPLSLYSFAGSAGVFNSSAGTSVTFGSQDDGFTGNLPIGFNFTYNGVSHSVFAVSPNGWIQPGQTASASSGFFSNALASNANFIAALWDDNNLTGGSVTYATTGLAGSQVLTVQWDNLHVGGTGSTSNPTITMQINLYEANGAIEIVYGTTSAALTSTTASIGISGNVGSFLSVTPLSPPNTSTVSSSTENTGISSATNFPTGTTYTFTPGSVDYAWSPSTFLSSTTGAVVNATSVTATTTYTVVTTAPSGCTTSGTVTLSAGAPLTCSALTASGSPCFGLQTVTANPAAGSPPYSYAWTEDGTAIAPTTQTITANVGTHTYNCQITDNCGLPCNAGDITVTTNALPPVAVAPTTGLICNAGGAEVTLTAVGALSYQWNPAGGLSASTGSVVTALPSASTTYTVTGTDINGCIGTATAVITVGNNPFFILSPLSADICSGASQVISITDSYSGSFSSSSSVAIPSSGIATPYPATLVVTGVPTGAVVKNVKIDGITHTFPTDIDILLQSPTGANVTLMSDVAGSSAITGINITLEDGAPAIPAPPITGSTYAPTNDGASDDFPLPGPGLAFTQATPLLSLFGNGNMNGTWNLYVVDDFTGDLGSLSGWSITFEIAADPSVLYTWSPAAGLNVTTGTTVTATPAANTVYTVTATVASGCITTATSTINVGSPLVCSAATVSSPLCVGSDFTVTANVTGGGQPYTYSWSDGSTTVYPATASITANLPAGTYNFTCLVTDDCGAPCNSAVSVTVNSLPAISVIPNSGSICNPGGSAIALTASNGVSYSWSPAAGLDVSTGSSVVANPSASTDYTVTGTDANGCVNTAVASITVGSKPVISANPSVADICSGGSVSLGVNTTYTGTFTASSLISIPSSGTATPYPATLSVSGVPGGAVLKSVSLNGITHTFPADIDIMLQSPLGTNVVLMSDAAGFSAITDVDITLEDLLVPVPIPSPPVDGSTYSPTNDGATDDWAAPGPGLAFTQATPTLSMFSGNMNGSWSLLAIDDAGGDLGSLSGWSLTFEAANDPSLTFTWSPASGLSSTTGAPVTASPAGNTEYTITATNASGCTSTATVQVNVGSPIVCAPATVSSPLCANSNFTVTAHVSGGGVPYTYSWSDGSTTVYPATASITANLPAGTYNFTCLVTDDCGATCSSDVSVTINTLPPVSVSPVNGQICNPGGAAVTLTAIGAASYSWSPSAGLSATTGTEVTALPSANTVYTVSATDINGCIGVATASIQVGFTPTGVTASATPSTVCAGDFSQLSSTGTNATPSIPFYSFSASNGVFTSLSGGTNVAVIEDDDVISGSIPIGFSFSYDGGTYTNLYASSNGFLTFNSSSGSNAFNSIGAVGAASLPLIAPLWEDLDGFDGGGVASYQTSGIPGNQVFTFEWLNWEWNFTSDLPVISFQAKLYEVDGHIEFIYNDEPNAIVPGFSAGASIGLAGSLSGTYLSLNNSSASPSASSSIPTNDIGTKPATGQVYSFTPPVLALSYSWQPAAGLKPNANVQNPETPALPAGTTVYTVTVSSNGCSATATTSVTSGELLVCSDVTTSGPLCSGGFTATANHVGGGAPFSYAWSDGVGGVYPDAATVTVTLAAGTYSLDCIVSDGCGATCLSSVTVIVAQTPSASIAEGASVVVCTDDLPIAVTLNAVTDVGGATYQWYKDGIGIGGQTASSLSVTTVGSYTVVVKNGACVTESAPTVVSVGANPPAPSVTPSNVDVCIGALTSSDFSATCAGSQTVTFTVSSGLPLTWTSTSPSLPNFDVATMPVTFPAGSVITDIEVSVNVAHTWGGDIQMVLEAPNLDFVGLLFDPLDGNTDFGSAGGVVPTLPYTFTSTGAAVPASGAVASPGPYAPVTYPGGVITTFADFIGDDPNGTWNLYVGDDVGGDGGTVENWTMTITVTLPPSSANWYDMPVAGSLLSTGSTFNPITDGGASTAAAGVQTFYAECSSSGCASPRTPVTFTVNSCGVILNSSIFVQGYYTGSGLMETNSQGALSNSGVPGAIATDADTVRIAAMDPTCPNAEVQEQLGILHTDGSISVTFTAPVVAGNAYYLRVIHRNSVETWSAAPVVLNPVTSYSFSSAATQAFGGNQADLGDGNFAIYSGDILRDGAIDGSDFLELDPSIQATEGGYKIGDLNGDGAVDGSDFLILDPNIQNTIGSALPSCP